MGHGSIWLSWLMWGCGQQQCSLWEGSQKLFFHLDLATTSYFTSASLALGEQNCLYSSPLKGPQAHPA